jgi:hypothetical protein
MNNAAHRKKRLSRQSRSALAWGFGTFLLLQLGLAGTLYLWWPEVGDPECYYKKERLVSRYRHSPGPTTSVWMLGSSRTAAGFQARILEERLAREVGQPAIAFNLGLTGAGPIVEMVALKRLLAEGIRPDLLLIEVLPPLFADPASQPIEGNWLAAPRFQLGELSLVERYGLGGKQMRRDWYTSLLVPWYSQRFNLLSRVMPAWLPWQLRKDWFLHIDDSGWIASPQVVATPDMHRRAVKRTQEEYAPMLANARLEGHACQALRDILDLCRHEGIRTALVLMPEGTEFRQLYTPPMWQQIQAYLDGLRREYQTPLINARQWIADEDFADSHHLLPRGGAAFTERLGGEVLAVLRQQGGSQGDQNLAQRRKGAKKMEKGRKDQAGDRSG